MMPKLTERQKIVLKFIADFFREKKYPAILMDIVRQFGMSYNSARYIVNRLAKLGYVDYVVECKKNRAIIPLWTE